MQLALPFLTSIIRFSSLIKLLRWTECASLYLWEAPLWRSLIDQSISRWLYFQPFCLISVGGIHKMSYELMMNLKIILWIAPLIFRQKGRKYNHQKTLWSIRLCHISDYHGFKVANLVHIYYFIKVLMVSETTRLF